MSVENKKTIEVRGFLDLYGRFRKKNGSIPIIMELEKPITGAELAKKLEVSWEEIEVIFVNGFVQDLDHIIYPGDRVAFLPPGCPGPYRIALGFYGKNKNNEANFKLTKK
ncbi:MoaD/ThiS family protein [Natronincola ferrireducens]|uniref:ThiS family protein n=1 Tax=Natronincola ferrireducens TaxID=393762 RepID=A0A1G9F7M7_9FIRM|nr:MoaD/ThiS family protein [Natronincola ferrireducens]SDK84447.1 ThiS family protein [Natronincola ferrireducens]